jgi:hypothetical protein
MRTGLDTTSTSAVSEFNAKVAAYNIKSSLLESSSKDLQKQIDIYNQNVETYGSRVEQLKGLEANVKSSEIAAFNAGALEVQGGKLVESPMVERPYGTFSDWSKGASEVILGDLGLTRAQVLQGENLYKNDLLGAFGYGAFKEATLNPGNVVASAISGAQFAAVGGAAAETLKFVGAGSSILAPAARTALAIGESIPAKVAMVGGIGALTYAGASKGFTASPSETAMNLGGAAVDLAAMGVGGVAFAASPRAFASAAESARNMRVSTPKESPFISTEFGSVRQSGVLTPTQFSKLSLSEKETYNLYGTTTPIADLIAKQTLERRTESAIRQFNNAGGDILTRAYEMSRKEPAVAPWERDTTPTNFDLKTLTVGKSTDVTPSIPNPEGVVEFKYDWNRAIKQNKYGDTRFSEESFDSSQLTTEQRASIQKLFSNIPEPKPDIREPAIQSWEREEILKKLYPEEYGSKQEFGNRFVDFKPTWDTGKPSGATNIKSSEMFEPQRQLELNVISEKKSLPYKEPLDMTDLNRMFQDALDRLETEERQSPERLKLQPEVSESKSTLPYKEPIDLSKLNRLLPSRDELSILTESKVKSQSIQNIVEKGYDWNKARKMGPVGESSSTTPEVLLQLQSRVSPAFKARSYSEMPPYTSVPSNLELSAMNERAQMASSRKSAVENVTTTSMISDALSDIKPITQTRTKPVIELAYDRITMPDATPERLTTEDLFRLPQPQQSPKSIEHPLFETTRIPEPFTGLQPSRGSTVGGLILGGSLNYGGGGGGPTRKRPFQFTELFTLEFSSTPSFRKRRR